MPVFIMPSADVKVPSPFGLLSRNSPMYLLSKGASATNKVFVTLAHKEL